MAVHSHAFRPYDGARTAGWARPLVLTRYALRDAFAQKKVVALLVLASVPTLVAATIIYLHHNIEAVKILEIRVDELVKIDGTFFSHVLTAQVFMAFLLSVIAGPRMLVADMRDNALPLYLSRPLSRFDYLLGKALAIAAIGSLVTWVPGLVLVALQASLTGLPWIREHWWLPGGLFLASWAAIAVFTLVCLAVASVVRRKAAAEGAVVAFFFVFPLVGTILNEALDVRWGTFLRIPDLLLAVWTPLLDLEPVPARPGAVAASIALAVFLAGAALVLERRVRAWEVVR
jgi:ABC-type transport system involved in multi-copper enzyme maturation permease subunit